jgi:hypothetical protein
VVWWTGIFSRTPQVLQNLWFAARDAPQAEQNGAGAESIRNFSNRVPQLTMKRCRSAAGDALVRLKSNVLLCFARADPQLALVAIP